MFTLNMNRVVVRKPDETNEQNKNNDSDDDEANGKEEQDTSTPNLAIIMKTINTLPDNHEVWGYMNPTMTYYSENEGEQNKNTRDFILWYDNQLNSMAELRQTHGWRNEEY